MLCFIKIIYDAKFDKQTFFIGDTLNGLKKKRNIALEDLCEVNIELNHTQALEKVELSGSSWISKIENKSNFYYGFWCISA